MVPRSLSPALRAVATLLALVLTTLTVLLLPVAPTAVATVPPEPVEPLEVTIETLTPGEIPSSGTIEVGGTVTNVDDETWTTINLYPLLGGEPMTTPAQLREARRTDPLAYVGDRITSPGPYAVIDRLEPGQSATYSFTVARSRLEATARGVYWFGVHALGQDTAGRDSVADGRARTFLPLVEQDASGSGSSGPGSGDDGPGQPRRPDGADVTTPVPVALVVPLRRRVLHEADGSLAEPDVWADELGSNGTLGRLVSMGAQADGAPITWLVDPALTVAAAQLAAGNPARSLSPTVDPDAEDPDVAESDQTPSPTADGTTDLDGEDEESLGPTASPSPSGSLAPDPVETDDLDPAVRSLARAAEGWLDSLSDAVRGGHQVLALPFGDLDVAGAAEQEPRLYAQARRLSGGTLPRVGADTDPGLSSPLGYIDATAIGIADPAETILMTDLEVGLDDDGRAPSVVSVDGRDVVVTSSGAAQGGPGPGRRLSAISMRQRILSEAALRLLDPDPQPLVVVLPPGWSPDDPGEVVEELDTSWVDLDTVADAVAGVEPTEVAPGDLRYPASQQSSELDAGAVAAVQDLVDAGEVLQDVLTLNDRVGDVVAGEAFAAAAYTTRPVRRRARESLTSGTRAVRDLLTRIGVTTPTGVTLSSASGRLPATIVNDLDEPVTVRLDARSDLPMTLGVPDSILVPAGGRVGVLLEATTQRQGIHNVSLLVTSVEGVPLGGRADLPIRAAQVSRVIWLIMGSGAVLLFGMIGLRLVRRVREARRADRAGQPS
ncbi:MAG: DUF6049 family protein [Actinomycetota bacterium]|nr:DUF6049 family protein [Actinomycetota bacterium]